MIRCSLHPLGRGAVRLSNPTASYVTYHPSGAAAVPLIRLFRSTIHSEPFPKATLREALGDANTRFHRFPWHDT